MWIACLVCLPAMAEVFTYVDAQGNRVFTDQPGTRNAKRVPLATSNRMSANPSGTPVTAAKETKAKPLFHYDMLRVLVPEPDATIRSSAGELIVSVTSEPGLQQGHRYRLLLDGQPTAEPGPSPVFALSNIDRGSHNLSVEILDEQGRTVERTANQPFHMLRISLAQKRQVKPCTLTDYGQRPECPLKDKPEEERSSFLRFF
ncbi:Penicillin-Binding Protein Family [Pseudomonas sp. GM18]|nr:Penicillin-Binding Protein Family [Pseudomonas sp. GM18]